MNAGYALGVWFSYFLAAIPGGPQVPGLNIYTS